MGKIKSYLPALLRKALQAGLPQIIALLFILAFAVFAWQEPSQAPPGGNVPAPLNVGQGTQIKEGSLSLKTLILRPISPPNSPSEGEIFYSTSVKSFYYWDSSFWRKVAYTTPDCYCDSDQDMYYSTSSTPRFDCNVCYGRVSPAGNDCNDTNAQIYPGRPPLNSPDGKDNDCDGLIDECDASYSNPTDSQANWNCQCADGYTTSCGTCPATCGGGDCCSWACSIGGHGGGTGTGCTGIICGGGSTCIGWN